MDTNKDIKIDNLITISEKLDEYLESLENKNPEHRQLAIRAIEVYITQYVTPALYLIPNIDLNTVLGKHITGLALGVAFDSERENLDRPSDEELDYVFKEVIQLKPTPERRQKFWDAWLVNQSKLCIMGLCNFLKEPILSGERQLPVSILNQEIKQLQHILTLPMTPAFAQWIEGVLKWEKEALAEWSEETTAFQ